MATPFDKVLTNANVIGADGKITESEKQKFIGSVESILKKGSTIPGLEFPPDPFAEDTVKRLKESKTWKKTYIDGLLEPTMKSLDTPGNLLLPPMHDPSSTFEIDISIEDLKPANFASPDFLLTKTDLTPPEITTKLGEIAANIPLPQLPKVPTLPTTDSLLDNFDIKKADLDIDPLKIDSKALELTVQPLGFFEKLLKSPIDLFGELISSPDETLSSAIDGSLPSKILEFLLRIVKLIIAALGTIIGAVYILVATILAWVYRIVTAIAACLVSSIVGSGSISTQIYNTQLSS